MKRTLEINKTTLWAVIPATDIDVVDVDGFKTGEIEHTYSAPLEIRLTLYPSNGTIIEQLFGKDASLDMVAVSNNVVLTENTLLFLTEPSANYDYTYDYRVSIIKKSLNTNQYGLVRRT